MSVSSPTCWKNSNKKVFTGVKSRAILNLDYSFTKIEGMMLKSFLGGLLGIGLTTAYAADATSLFGSSPLSSPSDLFAGGKGIFERGDTPGALFGDAAVSAKIASAPVRRNSFALDEKGGDSSSASAPVYPILPPTEPPAYPAVATESAPSYASVDYTRIEPLFLWTDVRVQGLVSTMFSPRLSELLTYLPPEIVVRLYHAEIAQFFEAIKQTYHTDEAMKRAIYAFGQAVVHFGSPLAQASLLENLRIQGMLNSADGWARIVSMPATLLRALNVAMVVGMLKEMTMEELGALDGCSTSVLYKILDILPMVEFKKWIQAAPVLKARHLTHLFQSLPDRRLRDLFWADGRFFSQNSPEQKSRLFQMSSEHLQQLTYETLQDIIEKDDILFKGDKHSFASLVSKVHPRVFAGDGITVQELYSFVSALQWTKITSLDQAQTEIARLFNTMGAEKLKSCRMLYGFFGGNLTQNSLARDNMLAFSDAYLSNLEVVQLWELASYKPEGIKDKDAIVLPWGLYYTTPSIMQSPDRLTSNELYQLVRASLARPKTKEMTEDGLRQDLHRFFSEIDLKKIKDFRWHGFFHSESSPIAQARIFTATKEQLQGLSGDLLYTLLKVDMGSRDRPCSLLRLLSQVNVEMLDQCGLSAKTWANLLMPAVNVMMREGESQALKKVASIVHALGAQKLLKLESMGTFAGQSALSISTRLFAFSEGLLDDLTVDAIHNILQEDDVWINGRPYLFVGVLDNINVSILNSLDIKALSANIRKLFELRPTTNGQDFLALTTCFLNFKENMRPAAMNLLKDSYALFRMASMTKDVLDRFSLNDLDELFEPLRKSWKPERLPTDQEIDAFLRKRKTSAGSLDRSVSSSSLAVASAGYHKA